MDELDEAKRFLEAASTPGIRNLLQQHISKLEAQVRSSPAVAKESEFPPVPSPSQASTAPASAPAPVPSVAARKPVITGPYVPIEDFAWDQGKHNASTISVFIDLPGVGTVKQNCNAKFGKHSFDVTVHGLEGKNYRLLRENLEKDILPESSTMTVKANKIVLKLQKIKGEYSYEHWSSLTAKKPRTEEEDAKKKDPSAGIMDMMKDMYDDGDENMRKIIGEAMMKSQRGEKMEKPSPSFVLSEADKLQPHCLS